MQQQQHSALAAESSQACQLTKFWSQVFPSKIGRYIENRCHMGSSKTHNEIYHLQTKLLQCAPNEVPSFFEQELSSDISTENERGK